MVEDAIAGGAVLTCSVVVVLAGCEHPASRAVPASSEAEIAKAIDDFIAVISFTPKAEIHGAVPIQIEPHGYRSPH